MASKIPKLTRKNAMLNTQLYFEKEEKERKRKRDKKNEDNTLELEFDYNHFKFEDEPDYNSLKKIKVDEKQVEISQVENDEIENRCIMCGINMGSDNPRQLCGKISCINNDEFLI
jgi:hypothetical protein